VIVVGGGHNGLITAAYLAKSGADVLVLERRHCVGGAAVTEEIVPGFKFSRASYLAGLLRPKIIEDLELEKYGFKYLVRNPSSFTPTPLDSEYKGKYLILGSDAKKNRESIAQFSEKDAQVYDDYEDFLGKVREIITPIVDAPPPDLLTGNWRHKLQTLSTIGDLIAVGAKNREVLIPFGEIMVGPAETILDRWFESDILKTTLATDAVIGAQTSPKNNGSAYVLMHHVMGEAAGVKGVWAYVEGGMGAISNAIAASAEHHGAEIITDATVREIMCEEGRALGVVMKDGTKIYADTIISGASPYHTFSELIPRETLTSSEQASFLKHVENTDMSCGAFKINLALKTLPEFACYPSPRNATGESIPGPMHMGTVHFEHSMKSIEEAYKEASMGKPATRPVIEMTIPSAVDSTVAPPGQHVAQLFIQYAPYEVRSEHLYVYAMC
jgi:phytoene dehydrogenase-like protein